MIGPLRIHGERLGPRKFGAPVVFSVGTLMDARKEIHIQDIVGMLATHMDLIHETSRFPLFLQLNGPLEVS